MMCLLYCAILTKQNIEGCIYVTARKGKFNRLLRMPEISLCNTYIFVCCVCVVIISPTVYVLYSVEQIFTLPY